MESIPSSESLCARQFTLNERQQQIVTEIVTRLNETIPTISAFQHATEDELQYVRLVVLAATRFYVDQFSRENSSGVSEVMVVPIPTENETIFLLTRSTETITRLIYVHIVFNLSMNGVFTEYWENIRPAVAFSVAGGRDVFIHTEMTLDNYQEALDRSFEEAREHTLHEIYDVKHNHILHFSDKKQVPRTDENNDCQLCYLKADYICEECKYALCSDCIRRIKTSNNTCPCCRHHPIVLQRIAEGNFEIESEPNDVEDETNSQSTNDENQSNSDNVSNSQSTVDETIDECDNSEPNDTSHNEDSTLQSTNDIDNDKHTSNDVSDCDCSDSSSSIIDVIDHLQP